MTTHNPHIGSDFDSFLDSEGILDEVSAVAVKRVLAWQLEQAMKAQHLTKTEMAKRMHTSRSSLNRLLDEEDTSLTLTTLASAAQALGKRIRIELIDQPA
ncbi:MAG: helix-turn-helix transcriptional regulator [Moraxellaceae bacterium]|jgi:predicted XRE-type DNA-binding protein